jgi:hypothetical protein
VILNEKSLARPERYQIDGGAASIFAALFRIGTGGRIGFCCAMGKPVSTAVWTWSTSLAFTQPYFTGNKKCKTLFPACRKLQKHDLIPTLSGRTLIGP